MRFAIRFVGLISTLVLARVLVPDDFGLVALAMAYLTILEGITAINLNGALIKIRDESPSLFNTVWTIGLIRSAFISLIIILSTGFLPGLVNEPRLETVALIIAIVPFLQGLKSPKFVLFEKNLDYKPMFIATIIAKIISTSVTLTIAIVYQTYWALIIGTIISYTIEFIVSYILAPYWPRLTLSRWREIFGFTAWLSGATILATVGGRADGLIVSAFLDTRFVGYYRVGDEIMRLPVSELVEPLTRIFFPAFAEMANDKNALRQNVVEASAMIALFSIPTTFGFGYLASDIVLLLVGPQWDMIVPMVAIVCPVMGLQVIATIANSLAMATGNTAKLFQTSSVFFVSRLAFILTAISTAGFIGLIIARGITGLIRLGLYLWLMQRCAGGRFLAPIVAGWRSIFACALMLAVISALDHWLLDFSHLGPKS